MGALIRLRALTVDVDAGIVYGSRGRAIGSYDSSGYLQIDAVCNGGVAAGAHRIVWEAAHGPVRHGFEINHLNDNRIANLEEVTHRSNILHAYRTGLKSNAGECHPSHKLTASDVAEIRQAHKAGASKQSLADRFGVVRRTVNDVVLGNTWKEVA